MLSLAMEFARGVVSATRAAQLISALGLWRKSLRVMALHLIALVGLGLPVAVGCFHLLTFVARHLGAQGALDGWWLLALEVLVSLGLSLVVVMLMSQAIAMPLLEPLSAAVEARVGCGRPPSVPLGVLMALRLGLCDALGALALAALVLPLQLVLAVVLPIVGLPLGYIAAALVLAHELCTLPLARRGVGYVARWRWVVARLPAMLGFGLSVEAVLLLPVTCIFVLPVACVGGTWLFCQLDGAPPP